MAPGCFPSAAILIYIIVWGSCFGDEILPARKKTQNIIPSSGPFTWLQNRHAIMSKVRSRRMHDTLRKAIKLADDHCRDMFQYDLWNCSTTLNSINFFRDGTMYRESAFLYGFSTAALMHVTAQACAKGRLKACNCTLPSNSRYDTRCTEVFNKFARRITRKLIQEKDSHNSVDSILKRHNMNVGMQVAGQLKEKCRYRNENGSVKHELCWKTTKHFTEIAKELKRHYYKAQQVDYLSHNRGNPQKDYSRKTFMYFNNSPNFCRTTRGRTCKEARNCYKLCCARGYIQTPHTMNHYCNCLWTSHFKLSCEVCDRVEVKYTCK